MIPSSSDFWRRIKHKTKSVVLKYDTWISSTQVYKWHIQVTYAFHYHKMVIWRRHGMLMCLKIACFCVWMCLKIFHILQVHGNLYIKNTAWTAVLYKIQKHEPQASACYIIQHWRVHHTDLELIELSKQ